MDIGRDTYLSTTETCIPLTEVSSTRPALWAALFTEEGTPPGLRAASGALLRADLGAWLRCRRPPVVVVVVVVAVSASLLQTVASICSACPLRSPTRVQ